MPEVTESGAYMRSLGGLTFTVTISEAEKQTAKLTDYPVEDGVSYSDHVILAPREVTVQVGQGVDESETDPRDKLDKLRELMEANGVTKWECDAFTASIGKESTTNTFDTTAFKEADPDTYIKYLKKNTRKGSFTIKAK